ncbi:hypothetical protein LBMAG18_01870 [Alphaproteobacteria bacterium]|nr:hypothetical protein LBMAG18_01870 [Alphaproteobacteria bacterium]
MPSKKPRQPRGFLNRKLINFDNLILLKILNNILFVDLFLKNFAEKVFKKFNFWDLLKSSKKIFRKKRLAIIKNIELKISKNLVSSNDLVINLLISAIKL